mmetsp:Transcript_49779/g.83398  ORF Transcript_49779/g.83398 Transcript_49779/m.83398 type:complete len:388 (+) Transcript_49779:731-1894(+)
MALEGLGEERALRRRGVAAVQARHGLGHEGLTHAQELLLAQVGLELAARAEGVDAEAHAAESLREGLDRDGPPLLGGGRRARPVFIVLEAPNAVLDAVHLLRGPGPLLLGEGQGALLNLREDFFDNPQLRNTFRIIGSTSLEVIKELRATLRLLEGLPGLDLPEELRRRRLLGQDFLPEERIVQVHRLPLVRREHGLGEGAQTARLLLRRRAAHGARLGLSKDLVDVRLFELFRVLVAVQRVNAVLQHGRQLFGREVLIGLLPLPIPSPRKHSFIEPYFLAGHLEHLLLVGPLCDEAVDLNVVLLPDAVAPGLSLDVVLGVPVAVEDDHGVGACEVDADTAGPCGQQEHKSAHRRVVEPVDCLLAVPCGSATVKPLIQIRLLGEVFL